MTAIFCKVNGRWQFYAILSTDWMIQRQIAFLKEMGRDSKCFPMPKYNDEKVQEIITTLNN